MGIKNKLKETFSFIYKAKLGDLTGYEFDHVFIGRFEGNLSPDPKEAEDWKWLNLKELNKDIKSNLQNYTPWFKIIVEKINNGDIARII